VGGVVILTIGTLLVGAWLLSDSQRAPQPTPRPRPQPGPTPDNPVEASDRPRRDRTRRPPAIDTSADPDLEQIGREDPCAINYPGMRKCSELPPEFRHDDFESALREAIERLGADAIGPDGSPKRFRSSRGAEPSTEEEYGQHQTWWSDDERIKISVGCTTCCENVSIGTGADGLPMFAAVPRQRCGVLNVVQC
jgi:hypothetical protein